MLTHSHFLSLAEAAVAAPSADNRHLFELRYDAYGVNLYASPEYRAAEFHRRVLARISFGAVIENIVVRARRIGYSSAVTHAPEADDSSPIARIQLQREEPQASPLDDAISARQTNRKVRYRGPGLTAPDLEEIIGMVADLTDVTLQFVSSPRQRSTLLRLVRIAEAERFNTRSLHRELFSAVRFDVGWTASADIGLPPGALEVELPMRVLFERLADWKTMDTLRKLGVHHLLGFRAGFLPCWTAPNIGVLYTSAPIELGAFSVGRALQRVWLDAERRGLAFQPLAASPLFALPEYVDVPSGTAEALRSGWRELSPLTPVMVLRMGRAPRQSVRAGRPAACPYLVN